MQILYQNLIIIITNLILTIILIALYDLRKNKHQLFLKINNLKINIINKDNWKSESNILTDTTKEINIDFIITIYNNINNYNNISNIKLYKRKKFKYKLLNNYNLNISDISKSISGFKTYEKLKYVYLLPLELKEFNVTIKLTKEEYLNQKKEPIYIMYNERLKMKKINISKYLRKK